ncbi:MAG: DNRLRE domain-containing protein, partial [Gammaproteobacteria bacterium]
AVLDLYQSNNSLNGGDVGVHRVIRGWVEGTNTSGTGPGANWTERETGLMWTNPGGDYGTTIFASTTVPASIGWSTWSITNLVSGWVSGRFENHGLALVAETFGTAAHFSSSDATDELLRPRLTIIFACECGVNCGFAADDPIILSTETPATLGGLSFAEIDLAQYDPSTDTATLFFDGSITTLDQEIEALHVLGNGQLLLSPGANITLGGLSIRPGDLVQYDPVEDKASMIFEGAALLDSPGRNIDAVHVMDDGQLILSTAGTTTLGGLSFDADDLVAYDPVTDIATLFFDGSALFSGGNEDIDGLHVLENGHLILSDANNGAILGGLSYDDDDLVDYDPVADVANLYFNGNVRFQQSNENVISTHVGAGSGDVTCAGTFRDRFDTNAFSNSDGNRLWSSDWIEIDSTGAGPSSGKGRIVSGELRLTGTPSSSDDPSLARQADLTGYQSATLSFDFSTGSGVEAAEDSVVVEVSGNGGSSWVLLENFINEGGNATGSRSYNISSYIAADTQIRFRINSNYGGPDEYFYVDNVEIAASCTLTACDADYTPDTKVDEFYGGVEVEFASGLTFVPEGKTFSGVSVPAGGAWIVANDGQNTLHLRDSNSTELASCGLGLSGSSDVTGVAWIQSGTWEDHLAVTISSGSNDYVAFLDFDCNQQFSFDTQAFGSSNPTDVTYIGDTASGNYDGHLAISDSLADQYFIVDQAGTLQVSQDISGFASSVQGLAHLPGTDKLLLTDFSSTSAYRFDFELLTVESYGLSGFGVVQPSAVAVNPLTCDHVHVDDFDGSKFMVLNLAGGGGVTGFYLDEFNNRNCDAADYAGSDGNLDWTAFSWVEQGESNGACAGLVSLGDDLLFPEPSGHRLILDEIAIGAERQVDLSGFTTVYLSLNFRRQNYPSIAEYFTIEVTDGGGWVTLDRFQGAATDPVYWTVSYDIAAYATANTKIRILTAGSNTIQTLYVDNVKISDSIGGGGGGCDGNFRDEFNNISYNNDDGTLSWATTWQEFNDDNSPTGADEVIQLQNGSNRLRVRDNDGGGEGVWREADLTGAASATLSFSYKRISLDNADDYVAIEVSANGDAGPWIELDRLGTTNDAFFVAKIFDITPYISSNTRIRFKSSPNLGNRDQVWFDNVNIQCSP